MSNRRELAMTKKTPELKHTKKVWVTPKLIVHGDVEKITKEKPSFPHS
jgi:hypothetical protein